METVPTLPKTCQVSAEVASIAVWGRWMERQTLRCQRSSIRVWSRRTRWSQRPSLRTCHKSGFACDESRCTRCSSLIWDLCSRGARSWAGSICCRPHPCDYLDASLAVGKLAVWAVLIGRLEWSLGVRKGQRISGQCWCYEFRSMSTGRHLLPWCQGILHTDLLRYLRDVRKEWLMSLRAHLS